MKYFEVTVETSHACSDSVSAVLLGMGCEGVAVYDSQDYLDLIREGKNWDYVEEEILSSPIVTVQGFFTDDKIFAKVQTEISALGDYNEDPGSLKTTGVWLDDADYAEEWKKYYHTIVIGELAVVPSWLSPEADKINVLLDPGAAFGTGAHETTAMCLEELQRLGVCGKHVLDVGCGSGILGIAALKLGASRVDFIDADSQATEVCRANVMLNGETNSRIVCGDLRKTDMKADFILANITADVLISLSANVSEHLNAGGKVLLSGIIDREYARVCDAYEAAGYRISDRRTKGDWHTLVLERAV